MAESGFEPVTHFKTAQSAIETRRKYTINYDLGEKYWSRIDHEERRKGHSGGENQNDKRNGEFFSLGNRTKSISDGTARITNYCDVLGWRVE